MAGYENPLEGLEDRVGLARIHAGVVRKRTYTITSISEEELVEVMSALADWLRDTQHTADIYNDFSAEMSVDEEEAYKALQYQSAVVDKFLEGIKTPVAGNRDTLRSLGLA